MAIYWNQLCWGAPKWASWGLLGGLETIDLHIVVYVIYPLILFQALICLIDKKTGEKSKTRPRFVKQDQIAIVRLEVTGGMICLETFKEFPQMGRFTLRDEGMFALFLI